MNLVTNEMIKKYIEEQEGEQVVEASPFLIDQNQTPLPYMEGSSVLFIKKLKILK